MRDSNIWQELSAPLPPFDELVRSYLPRATSDVDYIQDPATGRFEGSRPGGGGGETAPAGGAAKLDPEVIAVGGDEWNKDTAKRLEAEYQAARPEVDKLAQAAAGKPVEGPSDEEEEPKFVPEEWDHLSADGQQ
jgi:hypothetical protein